MKITGHIVQYSKLVAPQDSPSEVIAVFLNTVRDQMIVE